MQKALQAALDRVRIGAPAGPSGPSPGARPDAVAVRLVTTRLTAGGMALVVFVFATVLRMSEGIRATLMATGQPDNVLVLRKGAVA